MISILLLKSKYLWMNFSVPNHNPTPDLFDFLFFLREEKKNERRAHSFLCGIEDMGSTVDSKQRAFQLFALLLLYHCVFGVPIESKLAANIHPLVGKGIVGRPRSSSIQAGL